MRTVFRVMVVGWVLGASAACGVEDAPPLMDAGGEERMTGKVESRSAVAATRGGAPTPWDVLKGESAPFDETGAIGGEAPGDDDPVAAAPSDPLASLGARVQEAGPRAARVLEDALKSEDLPLRFAAIERLGEMSEWDGEARRTLEAFRDGESDDGLQRYAADLLARHQPLVPRGYATAMPGDETEAE